MPNPYAPPDPNAPPPPKREWPDREAERRRRDDQRRSDQGDGGSGDPEGKGGGRRRDGSRAPTPEEARAASKSVLTFAVMMFCGLLALNWPIPWQLAAPLFFAVSVALGIRALIVHRRISATGTFSVFLIFGVGMAGLLTFSALAPLALWDAQVERQECLDSALTIAAEQQCEDAYADALANRFDTE
ncbi:hypothetical protein [Ruania halotolerans]|uniref:hypothetical protein n=1 Tax=Ruania halotolerans TaxID=2897773 RepID=UPI001E305FF5|nr:hypothetical protein [Ruania halotolerans]UFU05637.1 hypothetical protein LQF10_14480 [Ruania halotolerans]